MNELNVNQTIGLQRPRQEVLNEINRVESERQTILMKDYLTTADRQRLTQIRDEILPALWERRRHEQDAFYNNRPYDAPVLEEDNATASHVVDFNRDNRRGPRLPSGRSRKNNAA